MRGLEASVQKHWEVASVEDLGRVVPEVVQAGKGISVWLLSGQMGAGKTTFVRSWCDFFGTTDNVSSPTFPIVNEYLLSSGDKIYHFDLYRLNSLREAQDIGIEEYLDSGSCCLIEWPGIIESILPDQYIELTFDTQEEQRRTISLKRHEGQN
jgi:tRNA threonylcarbamoyladenosine biosynthesis protein TsaE